MSSQVNGPKFETTTSIQKLFLFHRPYPNIYYIFTFIELSEEAVIMTGCEGKKTSELTG